MRIERPHSFREVTLKQDQRIHPDKVAAKSLEWAQKQVDSVVKMPSDEQASRLRSLQSFAIKIAQGRRQLNPEQLTQLVGSFQQQWVKEVGGAQSDLSQTAQATPQKMKALVRLTYAKALEHLDPDEVFVDERPLVRELYGSQLPSKNSSVTKTSKSDLLGWLATSGPEGKREEQLAKVAESAFHGWDNWDQDNDRNLSRSELLAAAKNPHLSKEETIFIVGALTSYKNACLGAGSSEAQGIPKAIVSSMISSGNNFYEDDSRRYLTFFKDDVQELIGRAEMATQDSSSLMTAKQGTTGDCWLMAGVIGMSEERLEELELEPSSELTLADRLLLAKEAPDTVLNLEKAIGELRQSYAPNEEEPLNGGFPEEGIAYLSGGSKADVVLTTPEASFAQEFGQLAGVGNNLNQLNDFLETKLASGKLVSASTDTRSSDKVKLENGLNGSHVYSVLAYDDSRKVVTVQNPWKHNDARDKLDGVNDGKLELSLLEFASSFRKIVAEA